MIGTTLHTMRMIVRPRTKKDVTTLHTIHITVRLMDIMKPSKTKYGNITIIRCAWSLVFTNTADMYETRSITNHGPRESNEHLATHGQ